MGRGSTSPGASVSPPFAAAQVQAGTRLWLALAGGSRARRRLLPPLGMVRRGLPLLSRPTRIRSHRQPLARSCCSMALLPLGHSPPAGHRRELAGAGPSQA